MKLASTGKKTDPYTPRIGSVSQKMDHWLGALLLGLFMMGVISFYWHNWPLDLSALYFAAYFYHDGAFELVYSNGSGLLWQDAPEEWRALAAAQSRPSEPLTAYVYPPLWADLLGPVAHAISYVEFSRIALVFFSASIGCSIILSYWLGRRLAFENHRGAPRFWVWCLMSCYAAGITIIGVMSLLFLQPQIFVLFLLLAVLVLLVCDQNAGAGALLALAAALKLMPAMLVIVLVMERRWRAVAAFVVSGAILALCSIALAGWPLHQIFLEKIATLNSQTLLSNYGMGVDLLFTALADFASGGGGQSNLRSKFVEQPAAVGLVAKLFLVVGVWATWSATRHRSPITRLWFRYLLVYLFVVLSSPMSWIHYLFLPGLLLPGLLCIHNHQKTVAPLCAIAAFFSMPFFWMLLQMDLSGYSLAGLQISVTIAVMFWLLFIARQSNA